MLVAGAAACGRGATATWHDRAAAAAAPATSPSAGPSAAAAPTGTAPAKRFAVAVRTLPLRHGADRPLPTTVWYPDAPGRFPLVLFSHGLGGLPENYAAVTTRWAAAGFVVAAPAYPHTNGHASRIQVLDIGNQPADGSAVLDSLLEGPLAGHIDGSRIAAAGHSAGGYTTVGMFTGHRDRRLTAGIVIAGGPLGGAFTGPAAPLLFVHGDKDPTVTYATGRAAYDRVPWPKAFLTVVGGDHLGYLGPGDRPFDAALATTTDFLRWTLYGDAAAKTRLRADGTVAGVSKIELSF